MSELTPKTASHAGQEILPDGPVGFFEPVENSHSVQPLRASVGDVTDTPAFKAWFNGSKVVDTEGNPLRVFHGTPNAFAKDQFQVGQGGRGVIESFGFHFGTQDAANTRILPTMERSQYERDSHNWNIMPVYLNIKNPLRMGDVGNWQNLRKVGLWLVHEGVLDIAAKNLALSRSNHKARIHALAKAIQDAGYDGIVYSNEHEGGESWIAFNPTQIKSAIGNSGEFNPKDKRITAADAMPTISFKKLYHVGEMDINQKQLGSHEGDGLSVSTNPEAWEEINSGHTSGKWWALTKAGNKFLNFWKLSKLQRKEISDWGVQQGLATYTSVFRAYDGGTYFEFDNREEAEKESDRVREIKGVPVGTSTLFSRMKQHKAETMMTLDFLVVCYAEDVLHCDGVWWADKLDVYNYSAPRGTIFNAMVPSWTKTEEQDGSNVSQYTGKTGNTATPEFGYHVTPADNLDKIMAEGLTPTQGHRATALGEEYAATYLFRSLNDVDDALSSWLGDEFEDEPTALLKVTIPTDAQMLPTTADYEMVVGTSIPPKNIKVLSRDTETLDPSFWKTAAGVMDNPAFKAWFAGSEVCNPDGSPMVMYHATQADIGEFRPFTHFGTQAAANQRHSDTTSFYDDVLKNPGRSQGSNIMPVYLSIKNALRLPDLATIDLDGNPMEYADDGVEHDEDWEAEEEDEDRQYARGWESEDALSMTLLEEGIFDIDEYEEFYDNDKAIKHLATKGYDGIVYQNAVEDKGQDSWIIFRPDQVKSATGNAGNYDPNNHNITSAKTAAKHPLLYHGTSEENAITILKDGFKVELDKLSKEFPDTAKPYIYFTTNKRDAMGYMKRSVRLGNYGLVVLREDTPVIRDPENYIGHTKVYLSNKDIEPKYIHSVEIYDEHHQLLRTIPAGSGGMEKQGTQAPPPDLQIRDWWDWHEYGDPDLHNNQLYVMAAIGKEVVATANFILREGYMICNGISVEPEYRRKGIASAMYAHAEQKTGLKLRPHSVQSQYGYALWNQNTDRKFGSAKTVRAYHGTTKDFDTFQVPAMFHIRKSYAEDIIAGQPNGRIIEAILTINNPADLHALHLSPSVPNFKMIAKELEAEGYDGAQYRNEAWIAFHPEQIRVLNGKTASALLQPTPANIAKAREFFTAKWKQRAAEFGRPEPVDLEGACKFASLFAQTLFGGEIQGNYWHQFVSLPDGKILDLTEGSVNSDDYSHDEDFWDNPEHQESTNSCKPRVAEWIAEFRGSKTAAETMTQAPEIERTQDAVETRSPLADDLEPEEPTKTPVKPKRPKAPPKAKPYKAPAPPAENSAFKRWFGKSKVVNSDGTPKVVYHGTTHDFDVFSTENGNAEGHYGKGFYFTSSTTDLGNYSGQGPDLTSRIEDLAEKIFQQMSEDSDEDFGQYGVPQYGTTAYKDLYSKAKAQAKEKLTGGGGRSMPCYVNMVNPVIVDKGGGTWFEIRYPDEDDPAEEEVEEYGTGIDLYNAVLMVARDYNGDGQAIWSKASEISDLYGEFSAYQFEQGIRGENYDAMELNDEEGALVQGDFIAAVYRYMGFDGIIQKNADQQFKSMNMSAGTTHYIVWEPTQVKSAIGNAGKFDKKNPSITASEDTENFDRWFSGSRVTDDSGNPAKMYHGTQKSFDVFDKKMTRDGGFHFGTLAQAEMRGGSKIPGSNIMPCYLSIKKPRRVKDGGWAGRVNSAKSAGYDGIVYLNRYEGIPLEAYDREENKGKKFSVEFLDNMSDAQFKKHFPEAQDSWIAFEPSQIKSAMGNIGDYSRTNPSVTAAAKPVNPVKTKAFQSWYAGSKLVDSYRRPVPVYHATTKDFDAFDASFSGSFVDLPMAKLGFFFSQEPTSQYLPRDEQDEFLPGSHLKKCYLRATNPKLYTGGEYIQLFFNELNPDGSTNPTGLKPEDLRKQLEAEGHDSIYILQGGKPYKFDVYSRSMWCVFQPNQIKSAIGNSGDFNPDDHSITAGLTHEKGCNRVRFEDLNTYSGSCPACKFTADNYRENLAAALEIMDKEESGSKTAAEPWEQGQPEYAGKWNENETEEDGKARYQKRNEWQQSMMSAISLGKMTPAEAEERDLSAESFGGRFQEAFKPLPQVLYHVTTALSKVKEGGLFSRFELKQQNGLGLGGGDDKSISFTEDKNIADGIYSSMIEAKRVAAGEFTMEQMMELAKQGATATRPFLKEFVNWAGAYRSSNKWNPGQPLPEDFQAILEGKKVVFTSYKGKIKEELDAENLEPLGEGWMSGRGQMWNAWKRPMTAQEKQEIDFDQYKVFCYARESAGGALNPLFFSTDVAGLAKVPESEIAICQFKPIPGAMGTQQSALGEWRTYSGKAVQLIRAEQPGMGKTAATKLASPADIQDLHSYLTMSTRQQWEVFAETFPELWEESGYENLSWEATDQELAHFWEMNHRVMMYEDPAECPAFMFMTFKRMLTNGWVAHFSNHAAQIAQEGFTRGVADINRLGLTLQKGDDEKDAGGYNFGFPLDDPKVLTFLDNNWQTAIEGYGDGLVLARVDAVVVLHETDRHEQAVFFGKDVKEIVLVDTHANGGWGIRGKVVPTFAKMLAVAKRGKTASSEYLGNCTDDAVVEDIFGDATLFAQALEDEDNTWIDDNTCRNEAYGVTIKYDPETDIHSFYKTAAKPAVLYHVTETKNVARIKQEGLTRFQPSNWATPLGKRYGEGEVYAFTTEYDALRWASRMDWEFNKKSGSGKISIVRFHKGKEKWDVDNNDPLSQNGRHGDWLKSESPIPSTQIIDAFVFGPNQIQRLIKLRDAEWNKTSDWEGDDDEELDENYEDEEYKFETQTLPVGTLLYHGTDSKQWNPKTTQIESPAWFSQSRSVAEEFSTWHDDSFNKAKPIVAEYHTTRPIELVVINNSADLERLREKYGIEEETPREMAEELSRHIEGWIIPNNYIDGDDIMVCDATYSVHLVRVKKASSETTAYTVGAEAAYDQNLIDYPEDGGSKLGQTEDYEGGWVWKTPEEAKEFAATLDDGQPFAVYELKLPSGWEEDTYLASNNLHCLKHNAGIIRKVGAQYSGPYAFYIEVPKSARDHFWEEPPAHNYEFWAFRTRPHVLKGERIIFTFDKKAVAETVCHHVEKPGDSKCELTGKYEKHWKVYWNPSDFKKYKTAASYGKFTGEQVVDYVQKMNKIDRQAAHTLVGLDAGGDYKLRDFPLARLVAGDDYSPAQAERYANQEGEFPPIVLGLDSRVSRTGWTMVPFYKIRDGNHRVAAAKLRGDKTIKAYVPLDSTK